ncbi:MAG: LysM peptidoglycan-binding domain-containing protein, partial [Candidatus Melainabacteria bacterium]|nr:LysM peptidoglycan-binding domain-containing protein [Candidatus Melainabacteria bacterium]
MNILFKQIVSSLSAILLLINTTGPALALPGESKSKHKNHAPKKIPVLPKIKVANSSKLPKMNTGKKPFVLKDEPTDMDIARSRVFQEPLVPMEGKSSYEETRALVKAIRAFKEKNNLDDVSAFDSFFKSFGSSRWNASLKANIAQLRFRSGYLSEAIKLFEEAWQESKQEKTQARKAVADKAISYLMLLQARLGMLPELTKEYKEIANRKFVGSDLERIVGAKTGIMMMRSKPGISFKCGPYAVNNVANILQKTKSSRPEIEKAQSTKSGTTLAFLKDLSDKAGVKLKLAKRSPGAKIIAPAVMHWKLGHFAAVIGEEKGRLHIIDPTFDLDSQSWITLDAFEKETDGNFLVPADEPLPQGWQALSKEEAKNVFGKGVAIAYDDHHPKPDECMDGNCDKGCNGMAKASAGAMNCTLQISDSPLGYDPPVGQSIDFNVFYQDMQTNQPGSFSFSNLGFNWSFNWLSYLSLDVSNVATVRVLGGGSEVYTPVMSSYTNEWQSRALLVDAGGGTYERHLPDGTVEIYDLSDGGSPANIFLTHIIDPQLNHLYIYYDNDFRVINVVDAIGQVSTISYADNSFGNPGFYKIASITDPFNRSCSFTYDSTFTNLIAITDVMGMQSKFTYEPSSSFITSMTNPYGTTSFSKFEPSNPFVSPPTAAWRGMRFTFPDGSCSVLESWLNTPQCSFYWDRHAMELYPNDPINQVVTHAKKTAWVTDPITEVMWPGIWFIENPLESSTTTFTYKDQYFLAPHSRGTSDQPASVTRSLGGNGNYMQTVTIDGTVSPGDVVGVHQNFDYCGYTVQSGDTLNDIANGLAKNINAYSNYRALGISAGSSYNTVVIHSLESGLVAFNVFKSFGASENLSIFATMPQTEDATVSGSYTPGDTFYVTIYTSLGNANFNYTTSLTDTVADAIFNLSTQINADTTCNNARISSTSRGDTLHLISYERTQQTWSLAPSGSEIITYSKAQSNNIESSYFQYDDFGNLIESIDPMGRKLTNIYDVNQIDLLEKRATTEADDFLLGHWEYAGPPHLPTKFIDGSAQETNYEYNSSGQILKITDADGGETKFEYTGTAIFTVSGSATSSDIISLEVQDPDLPGGTITVNYTVQPGDTLDDIATGLASTVNGDTDLQTLGVTATSLLSDLTVKTISKNVTNYIPSTSGGATELFDYFSFNYGFLTKIDGPLSGSDDITTFTYDQFGRLFSQTDSEGYVLLFYYDDMNRLIKTEYPDGTTEKTVYDRLDAVLMTDRNGRTSQKAFDNMDRLAFEVDPLGRKTKYSWCSCGSLSSLTDANNNTTSWTHDLQGRVTSKVYADSSTVNYTYEDRTSRLRSVTDALGQIKTFFYYPDGRLFQVNYSDPVNDTLASTFYWDDHFARMIECSKNDAPGLQYTYNNYVGAYTDTPITGGGMLSQVTNLGIANADITYSYDNLGRVINRSIDGANNSIDWSYDEMSRVTNETNALGSFDYHYVDDTPGSSKGTTRLASIDYPNGQVTEFNWFDNYGDQRLLEIHNKKTSGGPTLSRFNYEYDHAGQITTWSQQQGDYPLVYKLGYDQAGQLISARAGLGKAAPPYVHQYGYSYDPGANRTSAFKSTGDVAKISGSVTTSDVVSIIVNDASLPGGTKQIDYTVQGGDSLADIARNLSAAITSDSDMQSSHINAFAVMAADSPSTIG